MQSKRVLQEHRGPANDVWRGDCFGATCSGFVVHAASWPGRGAARDYLDVRRSGFLVWGGGHSLSLW